MTTEVLDQPDNVYERSIESLLCALDDARKSVFVPSPRLTVLEWAEDSFQLSNENSEEAGDFTALGYQRGILEAFSDPSLRQIAFLKSAQVGFSMMLAIALGYYLEHDPCSILYYLPTKDDVQDFYKDDFSNMVRDVPALNEILSVDGDNWDTRRTTKGSIVRFRSGFDAKNFRRIRARAQFLDEIDDDAFNPSGDTKEDKITAAIKRGDSFHDSKTILGGTPGIKGQSRCESWFLRGDQRRYFVPCPHCGEMQHLEFGGRDQSHGLKWDGKDPTTAHYVCVNGCRIEEEHKNQMVELGEWKATAEGEPGIASFHISALYSPMPGATWEKIVSFFLYASSVAHEKPGELKNFANLWLGETWEDRSAQGRRIEPHELEERALVYQAAVPAGVRFLTAGVDVQSGKEGSGGYFEVSIYGWGAGENGWLIGHWVLDDEPLTSPAAWENLINLLATQFKGEGGRVHRVMGAAIDSGGHYTSEVYQFCDRNAARNWWAIKGRSNAKGERSKAIWPSAPSKGKGGTVYSIDQDLCKDTLYRRLNGDEDAAGALRYPAQELDGSIPIDSLFYKRLTREKPVAVQGKAGKHFWSSPSDQEPWDTLVYAYAATYGLRAAPGGNRFKSWMASPVKPRKVGKRPAPEGQGAEPTPQKPMKPVRRPQVRKSSFMRR